MATLLSRAGQDMFGPAHFTTYTTAELAVAAADGSALPRPSSPPQPIPRSRPRQPSYPASASYSWGDALEVAASSASSDAGDLFQDACSELPSAASGMGIDVDLDDLLSHAVPRLSFSDAPRLSFSDTPRPLPTSTGSAAPYDAARQLRHERERRGAAEAASSALRQQLDEMSALLFSCSLRKQQPQQPQGTATPWGSAAAAATALPALLGSVLRDAEAAVAEQQQRAAAAAAMAVAAAADAAYVARVVAGMCARAAAAADLGEQFAAERSLLERRLERAVRMGQALLKHQREQSADPEPWRQQLLNSAFCVGCSILGAATAVLLIRRTQGP